MVPLTGTLPTLRESPEAAYACRTEDGRKDGDNWRPSIDLMGS
jgi:hypothetical protein